MTGRGLRNGEVAEALAISVNTEAPSASACLRLDPFALR